MKMNEIKVKLLKFDGTNFVDSKGIFNMENQLATEWKGKIFKKEKNYKCDTKDMCRSHKGKAVLCIDMKTKHSFKPNTALSPIGKCQNCLGYLMQEKNWKAHATSMKIPKWHDIKMMLAGLGIAFILIYILNNVLARI